MEELITQEDLMLLNQSQRISNDAYSPRTPDTFTSRMFETALVLDKFYTPLLCLFGALGNSLSLAVFCMDAKYRSQSSSYYLSALAVSDTGFLLSVLAVWLEGVYGGVITFNLSCPLVMYLGQVTCFMSVYFTVAFSIERYVAVHYPFSRPRICTRSKAKKVIAGITIMALLLFSYAWIIAQVVTFPVPAKATVENGMGQSESVSVTEPTDADALVDSWEFSMVPRPKPAYIPDHKSQSLLFSHHQNVQTDPFEVIIDRNEDEEQPPHRSSLDRMLHFTRDSGDTALFTLWPSSKDDITTAASFPVENQQNLNIINQKENDSSSSDEGGVKCICTVPQAYYKVSEIANYIDSMLTLIIPFFLIVFFNGRIAITVWKLKDQRRNMVATRATTASLDDSPTVCSQAHYHRQHLHPSPQQQRSCQCSNKGENGLGATAIILQNGDASKQSQQRKQLCPLLKMKSSRKGGGGSHLNNGDCKRVSSTVRFQDCIEMSQIESTIQGSSSMLVSQSITQSPVTPTPTLSSPRMRVVRRKKSSSSSEVRVTRVLLLVSLVFVLLNLPAHAIRCAQFFQALTGTQQGQEILHALQPWANILFNTNFAVNFLLYCVSGRNFRNSLKNLAKRNCQCRYNSSKTGQRFSWASDRRSCRKRQNSCVTTATGSTALGVPSMATLATDASSSRRKKNNGNNVSSTGKCRNGGYFLRVPGDIDDDEDYYEDEDEWEETGDNEDSTSLYLAYCTAAGAPQQQPEHDSYLNYFDEDADLDEDNEDAVATV